MLVRQIVSASLAFLVAFPSLAQQKPERTYGETLEIRVINVDVVVTDRNGKPVTGLAKDDFELFENQKPKEITNFLEVNERSPAAAAAAIERRHLVVFIDNTSLQPFNRDRVIESMKSFIGMTMRPNDRAMVVSWNPGLKENLALTGDRARVRATLQAMTGTDTQGTMLRVEREQTEHELRTMIHDYGEAGSEQEATKPGTRQMARLAEKPPYDRAIGAVRQFADAVMLDTKQKADALCSVMVLFRGVQGRKALIFVTESFSTQPARQMFEYLESIKDHFENGNFQNPRAEIVRYNDEPFFETVTSTANAAGVTLYAISAAGITGGIDTNDASQGGATAAGQTVGKAPGKLAEQSLQELAVATGGLAVTGTNDFNVAFNRISDDLTMYYSLGYRGSDSPSADIARKIDVRVKKPGLTARNRESFVQRATAAEIGDTISANLFAGIQKNDLGITISAGARTPKNEDEITVPVTVTIPVTSLTFLPQGNDVVGKFAIYAGFTRKDGTGSKISKVEYPLRFPAASMQDQRNVSVKITMTMQKTTENISVGVLDETSNATGFATTRLP